MARESELVEVWRLGVRGAVSGVVADTAGRLSSVWLRTSRFHDVTVLCERSLVIDRTPELLNGYGRAEDAQGNKPAALDAFKEALGLLPAEDTTLEPALLNNIGGVHSALGDKTEALAYYTQALPLSEAVGDRAGQAVTRFNIAMIYRAQDKLEEAVHELQLVVAIDRQIGHPDLASDTDALNQTITELNRSQQR